MEADGCVEDRAPPPPSTKSSNGWTYRARTPTSERVSTLSEVGDGEESTIWRAHGRQRARQLEPEFCLPRMNTRFPAYASTGLTSP
jgi:hypothetical protein